MSSVNTSSQDLIKKTLGLLLKTSEVILENVNMTCLLCDRLKTSQSADIAEKIDEYVQVCLNECVATGRILTHAQQILGDYSLLGSRLLPRIECLASKCKILNSQKNPSEVEKIKIQHKLDELDKNLNLLLEQSTQTNIDSKNL